jgi:hypothetical protein
VLSGAEGSLVLCADNVIGVNDLGPAVQDPSSPVVVTASNSTYDEAEVSTQVVALRVVEEEEMDNEDGDDVADCKDISRSPTSTTYTPALSAPAPAPAPSSSSKRTDMSSLGHQMIHPDLSFIDQEMRFREHVTATYSSGLLSLAKANGIVFNPQSTPSSTSSYSRGSKGSKGSKRGKGSGVTSEEQLKEEEGALMLLMQPMQALLDGTLLSAVSWQCRYVAVNRALNLV